MLYGFQSRKHVHKTLLMLRNPHLQFQCTVNCNSKTHLRFSVYKLNNMLDADFINNTHFGVYQSRQFVHTLSGNTWVIILVILFMHSTVLPLFEGKSVLLLLYLMLQFFSTVNFSTSTLVFTGATLEHMYSTYRNSLPQPWGKNNRCKF